MLKDLPCSSVAKHSAFEVQGQQWIKMMSNCRLLHVLQAADEEATDEEKPPHVAAAEREKQVYQKLSADYQASKEAAAAADAETAAGSLAPPQVSI